MLVACWAVKGGVGTSVVVAGVAAGGADDPEVCGVLVVDLGGEAPGLAEAAARRLGVPVVALLEPGAADDPPLDCHAYLQKPVTPFLLANALRNACEHARLRREHEATRRQLVELNAIGVRPPAERDPDPALGAAADREHAEASERIRKFVADYAR